MLALCDSISNNKSLVDVDFVGNNFEKKGASALVDALKDHQSLTKIEIGDNPKLGESGIKTLSEVLKSRYSVSKLLMRRSTVLNQ